MVLNPQGQPISLHSAISRGEGEFLRHPIRSNDTIRRTLEIGCGYGVSSLEICSSLQGRPDAHHTIIDPFQRTDWQWVGFANFELLEERSEFALPRLARERSKSLDLIFVDGNHTFDHALVDCFYATRLSSHWRLFGN